MADKHAGSEKLGMTPGKLKLVGLLSVILVVVLYLQYGGSGAEVAPPKPTPRPSHVAKKTSKPPTQSTPSEQNFPLKQLTNISVWKAPQLDTVIQYDPFALPATFPQPKPKIAAGLSSEDLAALAGPDLDEQARKERLNQMNQTLAQLRQNGVQIIITKGDEFVAMIGNKVYHVGDEIGGFKITAIDDNGVQVEGAVQQ